MYSEALAVMDRNMERYMNHELRKTVTALKNENDKMSAALAEKDALIAQLQNQINQSNGQNL